MAVESIVEAKQYLTFKLQHELFALDIDKVREVLDFTSITKVPQTPDYMRGVINLRGSVVPVVDLRLKFGMGRTETTVNTCVIISELKTRGASVVIGAMADAVQEVLDLEPNQIEAAPRIGSKLSSDFIKGMGRHGDQFIIILDIDKIFPASELELVTDTDTGNATAVNF